MNLFRKAKPDPEEVKEQEALRLEQEKRYQARQKVIDDFESKYKDTFWVFTEEEQEVVDYINAVVRNHNNFSPLLFGYIPNHMWGFAYAYFYHIGRYS